MASGFRVVLQVRVSFTVVFMKVPCYFEDLKREPNLENHPHTSTPTNRSHTRKISAFSKPNKPRAHERSRIRGFVANFAILQGHGLQWV